MTRILLASVALVSMAVAAPSAFAQTGPVNGKPSLTNQNQPAPGTGMTPESMDQWMKQQGYQSRIVKVSGGATVVAVEIQKDGWRFNLEFTFNATQSVIDFTVPLVPVQQLSGAQAMALMKFGYDKHPVHFTVHSKTNVMTLEAGAYNAAILTNQNLSVMVDTAIRTARESYDLWNPAAWTNNSTMAQK